MTHTLDGLPSSPRTGVLGCADISGDSGAKILCGLHLGPCLEPQEGAKGLQTRTPGATGPRLWWRWGSSGAPTPTGLNAVGPLSEPSSRGGADPVTRGLVG